MQPIPITVLDPTVAATVARRMRSGHRVSQDGCWIWTGRLDRDGYGRCRLTILGQKRETGAHRAAWLSLVGPLPEGSVIDHLCRNRACINPAHLEPVTTGENTRRSGLVGRTAGSVNRSKTHCIRGHEFTPENTHLATSQTNGYTRRVCIKCRRRRTTEYAERHRAAGS